MNLDVLYTNLNYVADQEKLGRNILIEELNNLLEIANVEMFDYYYDMFKDDRVVNDALQPFLVVLGRDKAALIVNSDGKSDKPVDYLDWAGFRHMYNKDGSFKDGRYVLVDVLKEGELADRHSDYLKTPTKEDPVVVIRSSYFQFYPEDIGVVELSYLKEARVPVYEYYYNPATKINEYSSQASVQLEWNVKYHVKFLNTMLKRVGIRLSDERLKQYISETDTKRL